MWRLVTLWKSILTGCAVFPTVFSTGDVTPFTFGPQIGVVFTFALSFYRYVSFQESQMWPRIVPMQGRPLNKIGMLPGNPFSPVSRHKPGDASDPRATDQLARLHYSGASDSHGGSQVQSEKHSAVISGEKWAAIVNWNRTWSGKLSLYHPRTCPLLRVDVYDARPAGGREPSSCRTPFFKADFEFQKEIWSRFLLLMRQYGFKALFLLGDSVSLAHFRNIGCFLSFWGADAVGIGKNWRIFRKISHKIRYNENLICTFPAGENRIPLLCYIVSGKNNGPSLSASYSNLLAAIGELARQSLILMNTGLHPMGQDINHFINVFRTINSTQLSKRPLIFYRETNPSYFPTPRGDFELDVQKKAMATLLKNATKPFSWRKLVKERPGCRPIPAATAKWLADETRLNKRQLAVAKYFKTGIVGTQPEYEGNRILPNSSGGTKWKVSHARYTTQYAYSGTTYQVSATQRLREERLNNFKDPDVRDWIFHRDRGVGRMVLDCVHPCVWGTHLAFWNARLLSVFMQEVREKKKTLLTDGDGPVALQKHSLPKLMQTMGLKELNLSKDLQDFAPYLSQTAN